MDKNWMTKAKWSREYIEGVESFLKFATQSKNSIDKILCPCKVCINRYFYSMKDVKEHLISNGFFVGYTVWNRHGEEHTTVTEVIRDEEIVIISDNTQVQPQNEQSNMDDIGGLLRDAIGSDNIQINVCEDFDTHHAESSKEDVKYKEILEDAGAELYPGCKSFSKLSFILHLFRLKCLHSWTSRSFDMLLELLISAFPEGTQLPKNTYETKKIMKAFDLGYTKIDACPNDCMLFWKDKSELEACDVCGSGRWDLNLKDKNDKGKITKKKSAKILRYFPLIPRLQRLFKTRRSAEEMLWHDKFRKKDGILRHPADAEAWKSFDARYPDFAADPRNVRLGLASDGFNPFNNMSSTYSIWPIILVPYNMAPWIGMKQTSFILSTIVAGPRSPGNDIDIYMQPLIQELSQLWKGVQSYDAVTGENFNLRATVMWTINDFPAYSMLSGWSTKGRFACPCCVENTKSLWLYKSKKFSYMGHRRWLPENHIFRRTKNCFDNTNEVQCAPIRVNGSQILAKLQNLQFTFGKSKSSRSTGRKRGLNAALIEQQNEGIHWKKRSIFFDLPYWEYNLLPHNLDVMHIEKNICDNFLGTLLDLDKSKDNLQSRLDLVDIGIKSELHPQNLEDGSYRLPPTCLTMTKQNKVRFCTVLKNIKLPKGYASNLARCVNVTECKIMGLKSHDCHIMIEELLPVALRSCAPSEEVIKITVEIARFLKAICATVINPTELEKLHNDIALTLCKMEKFFLPSFFTIMVHLLIHLTEEVKLGGPVQYRWMYPFERFFLVLKNYVGNKAQPEGSIAEGYIAEEGIIFCSNYLEGSNLLYKSPNTKFLSNEEINQYKFFSSGIPLGMVTTFQLDDKSLIQAHRYVLRHCDHIASYREQFIEGEKRKRRRQTYLTPSDIEKLVHNEFHDWFKQTVSPKQLNKYYILISFILYINLNL